MARELAIEDPHLNSLRGHEVGAFKYEPVELPLWDKLLAELGLTEREALDAVLRDGEAGRSIRHFARSFCRNHFVPERVLRAMDLS